MNKKRLHILECSTAHVLAEDIISPYGAVVMPKGTVISNTVFKRLVELGIEYIIVDTVKKNERPFPREIQIIKLKYDDCIKEMKNLAQELVRGERIDYSVIRQVSNLVISTLREPDYVINCLSKIRMIDDDYTYYHCVNVSFYAMLIAWWLNLSKEEIEITIQAALMHDLGKTKIPTALLLKKDKLNAHEMVELRRHVIYGYQMVKDCPEIAGEIKDAILMHHEREDKSGYPLQKGGEELSIYTKIVAVADVYDAMTSVRPYKKALTVFEAFEELLTIGRTSFDVKIVNTMIENLLWFYTGSKVLLSNGQTGKVVFFPPNWVWKPVVSTDNGYLDLSREKNISIVSLV